MPELPEVDVVRAGLTPAVVGSVVQAVEIRDTRSLRRHLPEVGDFESLLVGSTLQVPARRGKFLWIPLDEQRALLTHLGMSGQVLVRDVTAPDDRHVRIRIWVEHPTQGALRVDFADQRLFGSLAIDRLVETADGYPGGFGSASATVPSQVAHIARDALDPNFDDAGFIGALRGRKTAVKRAILDQNLVSGIGNIYADESLWAAKIHPEMQAHLLGATQAAELLQRVREVFQKALAEGGTSFDAQYVNVNGQAGYFAHSLNAYGRQGEPCSRCGTALVRQPFMNRNSHFCPRCQRRR